jgi:hypothetical protein
LNGEKIVPSWKGDTKLLQVCKEKNRKLDVKPPYHATKCSILRVRGTIRCNKHLTGEVNTLREFVRGPPNAYKFADNEAVLMSLYSESDQCTSSEESRSSPDINNQASESPRTTEGIIYHSPHFQTIGV